LVQAAGAAVINTISKMEVKINLRGNSVYSEMMLFPRNVELDPFPLQTTVADRC
jgi:hypothetical protein